jgi:hypothetical protein
MWPTNGRNRAILSASVTHNHPEGIKGALAVADAIFMCRYYFGGYFGDYETPINDSPEGCKEKIRQHIEREHGYDLSKTLEEIRPSIILTKPAKKPFHRQLFLSLKAPTSRTLSVMPYRLAVTATPLLPSPAV